MNRMPIFPAFVRRPRWLLPALLLALLASPTHTMPAQELWSAVGPTGGDARAFASVPGQPSHLYLGTTNSWIYESLDSGASWNRLSKVDPSDDLILDHIIVDPANTATIYVAAWTVDRPDGGLWISHDGGKNWSAIAGLRGQSIRAFAQAASRPKTFYAGTLEGVFRSNDGAATWAPISPAGSKEIHEVESLAVDPVDPNIIYAGTWHLPWKTTDGGANWHNIKQGLIDDSDVFSIIIDPAQPSIAFLSACSGIYKSVNGAELFHKIQGIPSTARRTRVLKQDPVNRDVVYAGTTEGLYKTVDGGKTFLRMTGSDVIVNDVFVDPTDPDHVLLATDRSGVLYSRDGAASFVAANEGFSGRKVEALLVDRANPARIFAGVVNDKTYGSVFVSTDGGSRWDHIGEGLDGRDVFTLAQAHDGQVLAGTNHGIFEFTSGPVDPPNLPNDKSPSLPHQGVKSALQAAPLLEPAANRSSDKDPSSGTPPSGPGWEPRNTIQNTLTTTATAIRKGKKVAVETKVKQKSTVLDGRVYALDLSGDAWLASTGMGLLTSRDLGLTWQGGPVMSSGEYITAVAHGKTMAAARRDGLVLSTDAGQTWMPVAIPMAITRVYRVAFSPDGTLWLGTREGVYLTRDMGKIWLWIERLPFRDVNDLYYDAALGKVLVSSRNSDFIYAIDPAALNWKWWKTGYRLSLIRAAAGRLMAASLYDGVLVEPQAAIAETGQR